MGAIKKLNPIRNIGSAAGLLYIVIPDGLEAKQHVAPSNLERGEEDLRRGSSGCAVRKTLTATARTYKENAPWRLIAPPTPTC